MSTHVTYAAVDYVVAAVILVIPMGIGIWYAVKDVHKATRSEYLLGGRRMSIFPVALSTFITFVVSERHSLKYFKNIHNDWTVVDS